jgi:hypothetical protein
MRDALIRARAALPTEGTMAATCDSIRAQIDAALAP